MKSKERDLIPYLCPRSTIAFTMKWGFCQVSLFIDSFLSKRTHRYSLHNAIIIHQHNNSNTSVFDMNVHKNKLWANVLWITIQTIKKSQQTSHSKSDFGPKLFTPCY